jgi:hypothetical protein
MNIDEITQRMFQNEIDHQSFREPSAEEVERALHIVKAVPKKKTFSFMALAALCLGCFVFAFSFAWTVNNMSMRPATKAITKNLPANPEEKVQSFWFSLQLSNY